MSLISRVTLALQGVATDIKALYANQGTLSALTTTAKSSLVAAINEVKASGGGGGASIDDNATDTAHAWSASKIQAAINSAISGIVAGASSAYDTLLEIETKLTSDDSAISGLLAAVGNRVRYDAAQTLTAGQQTQACTNLGIGDPDTDLLAIYNTAKQ